MEKIYNPFLHEEITVNERKAELSADIKIMKDRQQDKDIKDKTWHYLQALIDAYEEVQDMERWGDIFVHT